jgi:cytosine/adenosine deaminase-related metal-dependent hydrolase
MDRHSPEFYIEADAETSMRDTRRFCELFKTDPDLSAHPADLVRPILTPRFAISCTPDLMMALGDYARDQGHHIQTHMSESIGEITFTEELHPKHEHYAAVYDAMGLLGERTVLAHCVHLSRSERRLLARRRCGIAHCPNSNTSILSGIAEVRALLRTGLRVGLGTDVSGGSHPSVLDAARHAVEVSKTLSIGYRLEEHKRRKDNEPLSPDLGEDSESDVRGFDSRNGNGNGGDVNGGHSLAPPIDVNGSYSAADDASLGNSSSAEESRIKPAEDIRPFSVREALYLATLGGAGALNMESQLGSFEEGKQFDALLIDPPRGFGDFDAAPAEPAAIEREFEDALERWFHTGDDRSVYRVYVAGRCIKG